MCLCGLCLIQIFIFLNAICSDVCSCWSASLMPPTQGGFTEQWNSEDCMSVVERN